MQQHHRPHSAPITHHRELQTLLDSTARRTANVAAQRKQLQSSAMGTLLPNNRSQTGQAENNGEVTTYQMAFHLAQASCRQNAADLPPRNPPSINVTIALARAHATGLP